MIEALIVQVSNSCKAVIKSRITPYKPTMTINWYKDYELIPYAKNILNYKKTRMYSEIQINLLNTHVYKCVVSDLGYSIYADVIIHFDLACYLIEYAYPFIITGSILAVILIATVLINICIYCKYKRSNTSTNRQALHEEIINQQYTYIHPPAIEHPLVQPNEVNPLSMHPSYINLRNECNS